MPPPDLAVGRISSRREVPGFAVRESVLLVVRIWLKEAPEPRLESIYRRRNSWHMLLAALPPLSCLGRQQPFQQLRERKSEVGLARRRRHLREMLTTQVCLKSLSGPTHRKMPTIGCQSLSPCFGCALSQAQGINPILSIHIILLILFPCKDKDQICPTLLFWGPLDLPLGFVL